MERNFGWQKWIWLHSMRNVVRLFASLILRRRLNMLDSKYLTDEVIDGYKVSANRKKLWVTELDLLSFLEEICIRENINYYLLFGLRHWGS